MYLVIRPPAAPPGAAAADGASAAAARSCGQQQQQHGAEAKGIMAIFGTSTSPAAADQEADGDDPAASTSHAARHSLTQLHDSVLLKLLAALDARSKCVLMCTCRQLHAHFARREHWRELVFDSADEQQGLAPQALFSLLRRSQGGCEVIQLARSREARAAEGEQRFSAGYKRDQLLPHTKGLRAVALAALCPGLRRLSLDERASCVGGMTDDMARALGGHCPRLAVLEVFFARYSLPSEMFTDDGLIALSERCGRLQSLTLHNCDRISDRSMYALAANCRGLTSFTLGGYNEHITDGGVAVLFEAARGLAAVKLSSKLRKVTDASGKALAASCGASLRTVKLTRAMTGATILALARHCPMLHEVDLRRCERVSCGALQALVQGCPQLRKLVLPPQLQLAPLLQALPTVAGSVDESEEEVEEQQRQTLRLEQLGA